MTERFKYFDRVWFGLFVALTGYSAWQSYQGWSLTWGLLAINNLFDAYLGVGFSNGIKRYFYLLFLISSLITVWVRIDLGLYGSAVSGAVGAIYSLLGYLQYQGDVTQTTKHDIKSIVFNGVLGIILFGSLYAFGAERQQELSLMLGNFLVFTIGLISRYLLSRGKDLAYGFWVLYDIITFIVEFTMMQRTGDTSISIILVSTIMLFIIDLKAFYVWRQLARQPKT